MTEVKYNDIPLADKPQPSKQEDGKKKKVTQDKPKQDIKLGNQKESLFKRSLRVLTPEGGYKNLFSNIGRDVVAPMIRDAVYNAAEGALSSVLYKNGGRPGGSRPSFTGSVFNSGISLANKYQNAYSNHSGPKTTMYNNGVVFQTFQDKASATYVLQALQEVCEVEGRCPVARYYNWIKRDTDYTHQEYGWWDLRDAVVRPYKGEFYIDFPQVQDFKS